MCKLTWHTGLSKQPWNPSGVIGHMQDVYTSAVYLIWPFRICHGPCGANCPSSSLGFACHAEVLSLLTVQLKSVCRDRVLYAACVPSFN